MYQQATNKYNIIQLSQYAIGLDGLESNLVKSMSFVYQNRYLIGRSYLRPADLMPVSII